MGAARKAVRRRAWDLAGESAPTAGISAAFPLVIDIDATLVDVHLREGGCGADRQEKVRLPRPDRLDRPRVWWWVGCPYVVCQAAVGSFVAGWGV